MKYNPPYGMEATPDAAYINGNPSTGTMGSIPPAASIEYPQREIVEVISKAGIAPDNADLAQLRKALQYVDVFNKWKFSLNSGNASQWSATVPTLPVMPPPTGTAIWFKPGFASISGGTVFSVNGSAFVSVVCADLTPIAIGDVNPNAWLLLYFDGTHWQALVGLTRQFGALPLLTANQNWYVDAGLGDDTNYDGTSATHTTGTAHGPFKTLQRASNETLKYNMNGYSQYIHVADGAYAPVTLPLPNGAGWIWLIGNQANPQNCTVTATGPQQSAISIVGGNYQVMGFRLSATGSIPACGLGVQNTGTFVIISNLRFGPCTYFHMVSVWGSSIRITQGQMTIEAGATSQAHMCASGTSQITYDSDNWPSYTILGAVNFSNGFGVAWQLSAIQIAYLTKTGAAFAHGPQYNANSNSIINTLGNGQWPGDAPGTLQTGAQYLP